MNEHEEEEPEERGEIFANSKLGDNLGCAAMIFAVGLSIALIAKVLVPLFTTE